MMSAHQFLIFLLVLTEHQLVMFMHMRRPRHMQRTNPTAYQSFGLNLLHSFRNPVSPFHIGSLQKPLPVCRIDKAKAV